MDVGEGREWSERWMKKVARKGGRGVKKKVRRKKVEDIIVSIRSAPSEVLCI